MALSCFCVSAGARGVSVPNHFYSGGVPQGNSLRPALPPQRLPEERLESARLYHRSCRVSDKTTESAPGNVFALKCNTFAKPILV